VMFYEIVPKGVTSAAAGVDPLKYSEPARLTGSSELLTAKVRYKLPEAGESELLQVALVDGGARFEQASTDFRFGAAVALFGMGLRESPLRGIDNLAELYATVEKIAWASLGRDEAGWRREFAALVPSAQGLQGGASDGRALQGLAPKPGGRLGPGDIPLDVPVLLGATLEPEHIKGVIDANKGHIRNCYEAALVRDPRTQGRIAVRWTIGASGEVYKVSITRTTGVVDAALQACITAKIKTWRFPPTRGGVVQVNYPFVLSAN
jgi:hypothetical protein